jgi:CRP-like cAMP-binding protein
MDGDEMLFLEGDAAQNLYMLRRGKVLLNMAATEDITVSVMSVDAGDCFGWTALLGGGYFRASAVTAEPSSLWSVAGQDLRVLLYNDHTMGFRVMEYVARHMNQRVAKRTTQLFTMLLHNIQYACSINE